MDPIDRIPTPYVFTLETPLIMYHGRLLRLGKLDVGDRQNHVSLSGETYSLEEIETPANLESLFLRHNAAAFDVLKEAFITQVAPDSPLTVFWLPYQ